MFSKPAKGQPSRLEMADAPPASRRLVASLIAENVVIKGDLTSEGDVQLDGTVQGDVRVMQLTVGETGEVAGAISADSVEVRGRVTGTIAARHVRLHGTAHVEGDISHSELAVDAGARFQGRSIRAESAPADLSVVASAAE